MGHRISAWSKRGVGLLALLVLLGLPASARATVWTYSPSPTDMNDLDHYYLYAWRIQDPTFTGQNITSASITFNKMFNWDTSANKLFMWLFDTAHTPGTIVNGGAVLAATNGTCTTGNCLTQFQDTTTSAIADGFLPSSPTWNQARWLIPSGTANTHVTERNFSYAGVAPTANPTGWSWVQDGTVWYNNANRTAYTYTYTFQADELAALNAYIDAGNNFALGFDPDCHYYNKGISLTLNGGPDVSIPEPASLLLLGMGLAFAARRRRRV